MMYYLTQNPIQLQQSYSQKLPSLFQGGVAAEGRRGGPSQHNLT